MSKTKDKTYSVKYVGNASKSNGNTSITRSGGASIPIGGKGELNETEINNVRTAGLLIEVGKEVKESADSGSSSSGTTSSSSSSSS
jgi:hypothetical protein